MIGRLSLFVMVMVLSLGMGQISKAQEASPVPASCQASSEDVEP